MPGTRAGARRSTGMSGPTSAAPARSSGGIFVKLHQIRTERGLSINELAARVRMDPAHLELIERGSNYAAPSRQELEELARELGVPADELLD
ncbi:MAG TPA: helix-turn-helix transcriptional regulator [Bauldia sp.]|nr:helix-turn-helix transcriptional regulator [Bauldia sp.]